MGSDERASMAVNAMKAMGISEIRVEPVLNTLFKLYDQNWELIEDENYRVLLDAIFEQENAVGDETRKNKEAQLPDESSGPPLKRMRLRSLRDWVTSSGEISLRSSKIEEANLPVAHRIRRAEHEPISPQIGTTCKAIPRSEFGNVPETPTSLEIASSPLREIIISLNVNHASERPDFRMPSLNAILKAVEDKCLRPYRIREPNYSMLKLMQEMCQSFLNLSYKSTNHNGLDSHHNQRADGNIDGERDTEGNNPNSLQESTVDDVRLLHDVNDISKGEERVKISLIFEISSEPYLPSFNYIPQNIVYENACVSFSLAQIEDEDCCSNCFGDCLSSSIPCTCAKKMGGEFAYTPEGLIKEKFLDECISLKQGPQKDCCYYCKECPLGRLKAGLPDPCKGHLIRRFVKECWSKCGCNKHCGNRVVQRGITRNLQVFLTSKGKGWGLRTLEDLPKGTFVCEYVGEVLTNTELCVRNRRSSLKDKHTYPVLLDADWQSKGVLKDEEALCLDATYYGNVARFINHRCFDANLIEIPVEVETPNHHYYRLAFFTTRKVDALEELTWDYGIDFNDHGHPVKAFTCFCGSKCCRDIMRSHGEISGAGACPHREKKPGVSEAKPNVGFSPQQDSLHPKPKFRSSPKKKSHAPKPKPTLRFSPRLKFLPRTRSQKKP